MAGFGGTAGLEHLLDASPNHKRAALALAQVKSITSSMGTVNDQLEKQMHAFGLRKHDITLSLAPLLREPIQKLVTTLEKP